jgi:hypothetical protein
MRLFENWWDYVPGVARVVVATFVTLGLPLGLPFMNRMMGHFWD